MNMLQFSMNNGVVGVTGDVMKTALLNTVIGMGTVFVILIFISFLISTFALIPKLQEKFKKKEVSVSSVSETSSNEVMESESVEDLTDDTELVAVITAAIMAAMGDEAPEDGLVVRSIRKVGSKRKNFGM